MNRESFLELVKDPAKVGPEHLKGLEAFIAEFPYFATARMLETLALHRSKSIHYEKALKSTAIQVGDRRALYKLIMQPVLQANIHSVEEMLEEASEPVKPEVNDAPKTIDTRAPVANDIKEENQAPENELSEPKSSEPEEKEPISELEKLILTEAISVGLTKELEKEYTDSEEAKQLPEDAKTTQPSAKPIAPDEILAEIPDPNAKRSFSSWLKVFADQPASKKAIPAEKNQEDKTPNKKQSNQSALIDRFMGSDKQLEAPKSEFFTPANMARMSLTDDESFVTETLADIYAKQGHFKKAISAFKHLSLRIPEKSSYFASRIKELEKLSKK